MCFVRDKLLDHDFKHLRLCLSLQPEVCIKLLADKGLVTLIQVCEAVMIRVPLVSLLAVGNARQLQVLRLELLLVVGQVGSSVPIGLIACPHRLLLTLTTKVHVNLDGCLQSVAVYLLLVAISS